MSTYPYRRHGDPLRCLNVVPHAQVVSVLSYQHITSWDPLHIGAEVEDHCLGAAFNVVQMQLKKKEADSTIRREQQRLRLLSISLMVKCGELTHQAGTC